MTTTIEEEPTKVDPAKTDLVKMPPANITDWLVKAFGADADTVKYLNYQPFVFPQSCTGPCCMFNGDASPFDYVAWAPRIEKLPRVDRDYLPTPADVQEALTALGNTPQAVAEHLRSAGITGRLGDADRCPLAAYLRQCFPNSFATVYDKVTLVYSVGGKPVGVSVMAPAACQSFVSQFDAGWYPSLVDPGTVPAFVKS